MGGMDDYSQYLSLCKEFEIKPKNDEYFKKLQTDLGENISKSQDELFEELGQMLNDDIENKQLKN